MNFKTTIFEKIVRNWIIFVVFKIRKEEWASLLEIGAENPGNNNENSFVSVSIYIFLQCLVSYVSDWKMRIFYLKSFLKFSWNAHEGESLLWRWWCDRRWWTI